MVDAPPQLCIIIATACLSWGQETGGIQGSVTDPISSGIANAEVTARRDSFSVRADALGQFLISDLPTGVYAIEVRVPGFLKLMKDGIVVNEGEIARIPVIKMSIGEVPRCDPGPRVVFQPVGANVAGITGRVAYNSLLVTPKEGVLVTVSNAKTKRAVRSVRTDQSGKFDLHPIQPGTYDVTTHYEGLADFIVKSVEVKRRNISNIQWTIVPASCQANKPCAPTTVFPPLICL